MTNRVEVTKIVEGARSAYFHVYLQNDGGSGELINYTLLDPNLDFNPGQPDGMRMSLRKIWFGIAGFDIVFKFDDGGNVLDQPVWVLPAGTASGEICLNEFGGLQDRSGIDATGKLLISTTGFNTTADQATLVIKVNKTFKEFVNP